ncbi:MAG: YdcF family protein [Propioniciclava sp.]|jgi:hypothetical protein
MSASVLVLGCRGRPDGTPSPRQQWRVDLAARTVRPGDVVVFSGRGEAATMAADFAARHPEVSASVQVVLEPQATTTWENVGYAADLIPPGGIVRIVSDPYHVPRAIEYWVRRFPDRAGELRPGVSGRFEEHPLLAASAMVYAGLVRPVRGRLTRPRRR